MPATTQFIKALLRLMIASPSVRAHQVAGGLSTGASVVAARFGREPEEFRHQFLHLDSLAFAMLQAPPVMRL